MHTRLDREKGSLNGMKIWFWNFFYNTFLENLMLKQQVASLQNDLSEASIKSSKHYGERFQLECEIEGQKRIIEELIRELESK